MTGAGFMRAGLDPAGFFSNDVSPEAIVANAAMSRRIDPASNDYAQIVDGVFDSMPIVVAKVLMALGNKRGSFGWDASLGDPCLSIDRDNGKMLETATAYTRAQLKFMTDVKEIEILSIAVVVVQGAWSRVVTFRDLSTGQEHST